MLVASYYQVPALRAAAVTASDVKLRYGGWFAFFIGMLAGGVVPEIAKLLTGMLRKLDAAWARECAYNAFVYGIVGWQVDIFYRFQAFMFGPQHDVRTLVVKTSVDMGFFSTIISIPTATWLYAWKRNQFKLAGLFPGGVSAFYKRQVVPGLVPCWAFWIPVLLCTYAMPVNLQLEFSMLAEAAWSIVFVFIAKQADVALP